MTIALKTAAVFTVTCDVCGATADYDGGATLPPGWSGFDTDGSLGGPGRRQLCPTDSAPLMDALAAAPAPTIAPLPPAL